MNPKYTDEYIELLASKWKDGTLTENEQSEFDEWYDNHNDDKLTLPHGYASNPLQVRDRMHTSIKEQIRTLGKRDKRHVRISVAWQKIIAAASVLLLFALLYYHFGRKTAVTVTRQLNVSTIHGGSNKAILTLADGTKVVLNNLPKGKVASQQTGTVMKTTDGEIVYTPGRIGSGNQVDFNIVQTPRGGQFAVVLPDGSRAYLNAASSLKYPTLFSGTEREVELVGEAYFEISHNKTMPFIVKTSNQKIRVLGTHFNVNSYSDEGRTVTTLVEGSVLVQSGRVSKRLTPGNDAVLLPDGNLHIQPANMETAIAWKNNKMTFEDATIETVMRQVARWYDLDIIYEGKIPDDTFSGSINRQSNLSTVLKMFNLTQIKFTLQQSGKRKILTIRT